MRGPSGSWTAWRIKPTTKFWYLDAKSPNPVLKIRRRQLPLVPGYALTAHGSQGKTLPAVLLDLRVDKIVDVTFGAVAASRVRSRHDCLILRPFERFLFNRGVPEGPQLLLRMLRGEDIDWAAYREGRMPTAYCQTCKHVRPMDEFDHDNWELVRANRRAPLCLACKHKSVSKKRKLDEGALKYVCAGCKVSKVEDAFPRAQLTSRQEEPGDQDLRAQEQAAKRRRCTACCKAASSLKCSCCGEVKAVDAIEPTMITMPERAIACRACQAEVQEKKKRNKDMMGWFSCRSCEIFYPNSAAADSAKRQRRCLNCASRGTRQKDQQTCRKCKRTWSERQPPGQTRRRYCPDCRAR